MAVGFQPPSNPGPASTAPGTPQKPAPSEPNPGQRRIRDGTIPAELLVKIANSREPFNYPSPLTEWSR